MATLTQPVTPPLAAKRSSQELRAPSLLPLLLLFGALKVALQAGVTLLSVHAGYGLHRDELYYLVCGHRLAFGYVDQPPLVALQARLAEVLFGYHHLIAFRLLPYLAGALTVTLTGLLTQALGGTRRAAALAMFSVLTVPVFIATQSFLSMNAWEPVFWMGMALATVRLLTAPEATRWWLLLGASAGLALENKASAIFFVAALVLSLGLTPARSLLRQRGFLLACGLCILLALPNLWWQAAHGWPTWEWLKDVQHSTKDVVLSPPQFLLQQVFILSPFHVLVWLPGIVWLFGARESRLWRPAGLLYVVFLLIMMALHAKDYYVAPIYPLLFAAGAIFWSDWWAGPFVGRRHALGALAAVLACAMFVSLPFAVPVLSPSTFNAFTRFMQFAPMDSEQHAGGQLPEFFADQLGWQALANDVSRMYHALPPEEQKRTGIIADNYGQASALNILGRPLGLPTAISGHQHYWMWGWAGYTGQEMIVVTNQPLSHLRKVYAGCTLQVNEKTPDQMPWEQRGIYLCHDRRKSFQQDWRALKLYW